MKTNTKKFAIITMVLLLCTIFTFCLVACGEIKNPQINTENKNPQINTEDENTQINNGSPSSAISFNNGEYSYQFLKKFNNTHNARKAGSAQEYAAAQYIQSELESFGYETKIQPFSYTKNVKETLTISTYNKNGMIVTVKTVVETENEDGSITKTITDIEGDKGILIENQKITTTKSVTYYSQNVIAFKEGFDTSKQIIVGAHYDSVLAGYGIDDNASGVAVMLESAKYFSTKSTSCNIAFVAFGAEETGCNGSKYYVNNMTEEEKTSTKFMVNLDTLAAGDKMYAYGGEDQTSKELLAGILDFGKDKGLITQKGLNANYAEGLTGDWSDHAAFKYAGIPFICFESTNWDIQEADGTYTDGYVQIEDGNGGYAIMHTSKDKLDWIEQNFPGRVQEHLKTFSQCLIELIK